MPTAGQSAPVRFVLELMPAEHGRVDGVLTREGNDERLPFSGWLDLLRLLEGAAGNSPGDQHGSGGHNA
jgi:hypothetical protein